jgi:hypothetical protein
MSGTMTDRQAAEAAGLSPDTAAYTKSKPRVRAYMQEHRARLQAKLVELEAERLYQRNLSRDQVLTRLWELANLSPEATRGSIAGQMKALTTIVAMEGLIPDPKHSRCRQSPAEGIEPNDAVSSPGAPAAAVRSSNPKPSPQSAPNPAISALLQSLDQKPSGPLNPFVIPEKRTWEPDAITRNFLDVALHAPNTHLLAFPPETGIAPQRY